MMYDRLTASLFRSVLDYNPINTIASHMGYWADEDVNHFVLSQLLSNKSKGEIKEAANRRSWQRRTDI